MCLPRFLCPQRPEEGVRFPRNLITDSCEPPCGFWALNWIFRKSMFVTSKLFLQNQGFDFWKDILLVCLFVLLLSVCTWCGTAMGSWFSRSTMFVQEIKLRSPDMAARALTYWSTLIFFFFLNCNRWTSKGNFPWLTVLWSDFIGTKSPKFHEGRCWPRCHSLVLLWSQQEWHRSREVSGPPLGPKKW